MLPPQTISELLHRAQILCGQTVGQIAQQHRIHLPTDDVVAARKKGLIGQLIEQALCADAGNQDAPDFRRLNVELKTVPMDAAGRVIESTFVCNFYLQDASDHEWRDSRVWKKLRTVLWVPIEAAATQRVLGDRRIGQALLWRPNDEEQAVMRADWTLLTGLAALGKFDEITARIGEALQVRPKAPNRLARVTVVGLNGETQATHPRGYYLRAKFTEQVLWRLTDEMT